MCIPNITKTSQRVYELSSAHAFPYKVHSRETTQMGSKMGQPFVITTHHRLDLIYMFANYQQHISKGISVIGHTSFPL